MSLKCLAKLFNLAKQSRRFLFRRGAQLSEGSVYTPFLRKEFLARNGILKDLTELADIFRVCNFFVVNSSIYRVKHGWRQKTLIQVLDFSCPGNRCARLSNISEL